MLWTLCWHSTTSVKRIKLWLSTSLRWLLCSKSLLHIDFSWQRYIYKYNPTCKFTLWSSQLQKRRSCFLLFILFLFIAYNRNLALRPHDSRQIQQHTKIRHFDLIKEEIRKHPVTAFHKYKTLKTSTRLPRDVHKGRKLKFTCCQRRMWMKCFCERSRETVWLCIYAVCLSPTAMIAVIKLCYTIQWW